MPRTPSDARKPPIAVNIAAGLAGGLIAAFVMEKVQAAIEHFSSDNNSAAGGGGQQHRQPNEGEPATYKAADAIATRVTGAHIPRGSKAAAGNVVHYAFGGALGAAYGAATVNHPGVTRLAGMPFGAAVWFLADEIAVPAAGLAKGPTKYPVSKHASALAGHLVFGATTELARRGLMLAFRNGRRD
jgi:hypothetical protein